MLNYVLLFFAICLHSLQRSFQSLDLQLLSGPGLCFSDGCKIEPADVFLQSLLLALKPFDSFVKCLFFGRVLLFGSLQLLIIFLRGLLEQLLGLVDLGVLFSSEFAMLILELGYDLIEFGFTPLDFFLLRVP